MRPQDGSGIEIEHDGVTVALGGPVVTVGRSKDAALRVIHPLVSRLHCRIEIGDEGAFISDLESVNGTHVNGQVVTAAVRLVHGDEITLGKEGAKLRVRRAELDGRDLLDPDLGNQATMVAGDPRARDIAPRMELGGGATEQNTAQVPAPAPAKAAPVPPAKVSPPRPSSQPPAKPTSRAPVRPPGPPPPPKPAPPDPRPSPTVSLVPLPDDSYDAPPTADAPELPDRTIAVDAPGGAAPVPVPMPVDRTIEASPELPKDIYTVMPLASAVLGSADTSPIPAGTLRRVREIAAEREAAALAEAAAAAAGAAKPARDSAGFAFGLVAGLAAGVATAYGISLVLARSAS